MLRNSCESFFSFSPRERTLRTSGFAPPIPAHFEATELCGTRSPEGIIPPRDEPSSASEIPLVHLLIFVSRFQKSIHFFFTFLAGGSVQ